MGTCCQDGVHHASEDPLCLHLKTLSPKPSDSGMKIFGPSARICEFLLRPLGRSHAPRHPNSLGFRSLGFTVQGLWVYGQHEP